MRGLLCLMVSVVGAATAAAAPGDRDDYDPANGKWNGLSDFTALVSSTGRSLDAKSELSWNELSAGDAVFILYPTARIDPNKVAEFVRGGGRLLIADDFGRADEALARLGVLRRRPGSLSGRLHDGNRNLPIAAPAQPNHPLARGGGDLVTNHPSVFSATQGVEVVYAFGKDDAVVVAGELGDGRFVAVSDPSILINDMLAFDGNLGFAVGLLDWLVPPGGRVVLLSHDFAIYGEPEGRRGEENASGLGDVLGDLNTWLDGLNAYLAPDEALRAVGLILAVVVLTLGAVILPFRRPSEPDGSFARAGGETATGERLVAEYDDERSARNYAYPAAILRENVEAERPDRRALVAHLPARADVLTARAFVSRRTFTESFDAVEPH